ncbi:MAG TPA: arginase family protein [Balneolaceae bacterium]|nr:arginase family protein [Balneolaceae bacterium]
MNISLLQIPWDSGHYRKRMGQGPIHLVRQGLIRHLETKGNNVEHTECKLPESFVTEAGAAKELNRRLSDLIHKTCKNDRFPIILAGNCNMAIGVVTGLNLTRPGVVWFDAHADFNTPDTSSSGFFDGMGLSILTGNSWKAWRKTLPGFTPIDEQNVILMGARDLDAEERNLLNSSRVTSIPVSGIRNNPKATLSRPLQFLSQHCDELYIHIDLDVFDPSELRANEFYVENGMLLSEVKEILKEICAHFKIAAISFTSYDPTYDKDHNGYQTVKSILDAVLPRIH